MKGGIKVHIKLSREKKISKISKTSPTKSWSINTSAKVAKMVNLLVSIKHIILPFFFFFFLSFLTWGCGKASVSNSKWGCKRLFQSGTMNRWLGSLNGAIYISGIENSAYLGLASNDWVQCAERLGIPDGREAVLFQWVKLPSEPREFDWNFRHLILSEFGSLSFEMPCLNNHFNPLPIFLRTCLPMIGKINEQALANIIKPKHSWFQY